MQEIIRLGKQLVRESSVQTMPVRLNSRQQEVNHMKLLTFNYIIGQWAETIQFEDRTTSRQPHKLRSRSVAAGFTAT